MQDMMTFANADKHECSIVYTHTAVIYVFAIRNATKQVTDGESNTLHAYLQ